jgi:hypothetical protein
MPAEEFSEFIFRHREGNVSDVETFSQTQTLTITPNPAQKGLAGIRYRSDRRPIARRI